MKVTQEILDALVVKLVPEKYRPGSHDIDNLPTVTNISVMEKDELTKRVAVVFPGENQTAGGKEIVTSGVHYNWGLLRKGAKLPDWEKWAKSSAIFISDEIAGGNLHLSFIVLHEIGHVDWNVRREELHFWQHKDEELYCDAYAYEVLKNKYDEETAFIIMQLFGSIDGWNLGKKDD